MLSYTNWYEMNSVGNDLNSSRCKFSGAVIHENAFHIIAALSKFQRKLMGSEKSPKEMHKTYFLFFIDNQ